MLAKIKGKAKAEEHAVSATRSTAAIEGERGGKRGGTAFGWMGERRGDTGLSWLSERRGGRRGRRGDSDLAGRMQQEQAARMQRDQADAVELSSSRRWRESRKANGLSIWLDKRAK